MKKRRGYKSEKANKHLKDYFNLLRPFMIVLFAISIVQILFILLGYFPQVEFIKVSDTATMVEVDCFNIITILGFLDFLIMIVAGFYCTMRSTFKFRDIFFSAVLLFASEILVMLFIPSILPEIPLIFKIINSLVLLLVNFILFAIAYFIGGMLASLYKKIK